MSQICVKFQLKSNRRIDKRTEVLYSFYSSKYWFYETGYQPQGPLFVFLFVLRIARNATSIYNRFLFVRKTIFRVLGQRS